jgi:hypothetical protein
MAEHIQPLYEVYQPFPNTVPNYVHSKTKQQLTSKTLKRKRIPEPWKEEARLCEYLTSTNGLDLQGKTHHSI